MGEAQKGFEGIGTAPKTPTVSKQPSLFAGVKTGGGGGQPITIVTTKVKGSPPQSVAISKQQATSEQIQQQVKTGELIATREGLKKVPLEERERVRQENIQRVQEYYKSRFQQAEQRAEFKKTGQYPTLEYTPEGRPVGMISEAQPTTISQRVRQKVFSIIPEFRSTAETEQTFQEKKAFDLITPAESYRHASGTLFKAGLLGLATGGALAGVGAISSTAGTVAQIGLGAGAIYSAPSIVMGFRQDPLEAGAGLVGSVLGFGAGYKGITGLTTSQITPRTRIREVREISPKTRTRVVTTQPKQYWKVVGKSREGMPIYEIAETSPYSRIAQKQPSFIDITTRKGKKFYIPSELKTTGTVSKLIKVEGIKGKTGIFETGIDIKGFYQLKKGKFSFKTFKRGKPTLQQVKGIKAKGVAQTFAEITPTTTKGYTALDITLQQPRRFRKPLTTKQTTLIKSLSERTAKRQFDFSYTAKGLKAKKIKAFELGMPEISPTPKTLDPFFKKPKGVLSGRGRLIEQFRIQKQIQGLTITDIKSFSGSKAIPLKDLTAGFTRVPKRFARQRAIRQTISTTGKSLTGKKGQVSLTRQLLITPDIISQSLPTVVGKQLAKQILVKPSLDFKTLLLPQTKIGVRQRQITKQRLKLELATGLKTKQFTGLKQKELSRQQFKPLQMQKEITKSQLALATAVTPIQKQLVRQRLKLALTTPKGISGFTVLPFIKQTSIMPRLPKLGLPPSSFLPSRYRTPRLPTYKPSLLALEFGIKAKIKKKLLKGLIPRITGLEIRPIPI